MRSAFKYLTPCLLAIALFGCSSPAGQVVRKLGNTIKQCCTPLTSLEKKPVCLIRSATESAPTTADVSIFEIEGQLIHTW